MSPLLHFGGLSLLGLVIGYFSGLLGVGGGFMMTPLLISLFAIDARVAVGSGMAQMIAVGMGAARRHAAAGAVDYRLAAWMAPGVIAGTALGKALLAHLTRLGTVTLFARTQSLAGVALSALFVLLLAWVAARCWRESGDTCEGYGVLCWLNGPLPVSLPVSGIPRVSGVSLLLCGGLLGVMAGLMGIGGGVIIIPLLVFAYGVPMRTAIGVSSVLIMVSAIAVTVQYAIDDLVSLPLVVTLMVGSTIGVQLGAWHSHQLRVAQLHRIFATLTTIVAVIVLGRLFL